jgi:hypothetical protein
MIAVRAVERRTGALCDTKWPGGNFNRIRIAVGESQAQFDESVVAEERLRFLI